ncbi:E3 ubiquitin-protein ligase RNF217-like [Dysidea avara]|uniref:E3 ubiquitin-protein ligase RNF217-like n=1 Tax=Dysidea avara TaxID=196820 RepID=UPI003327E8A4
MTSLLEVLPCVNLSDNELSETFGGLSSVKQSNDIDHESDSGVESLADLEIASFIVPQPPSIPPAVPFRPPLHRWISREAEEPGYIEVIGHVIPAPPAVPPAVPFIPPLHRWISRERLEDNNSLHDFPQELLYLLEAFGTSDYSFEVNCICSNAPRHPRVICNTTCEVCFEPTPVQLPCCSAYVCDDCTYNIVVVNVNDGVTSIPCPSPECDQLLLRDDILKLLNSRNDLGTKDKYERFRLSKSSNDREKVCPRCSWLTTIGTDKKPRRWKEVDIHITCEKCSLEWCFKCHAPWHTDISCKDFKRGNKDFRKWIAGKDLKGNANGYHCPSCKIPIQRTTGCNHMTCSDCRCEFCYRCGCRYVNIPGILGDHYSKLGFAGCKHNYEPNNDVKRVSVRGGYLFSKVATVMGNPGLMIAGGAVLLVAGVVVVPAFVSYKVYKHHSARKAVRQRRERTRELAQRRRQQTQ